MLDKRKRGFFNEAVGTWIGADGGALVDAAPARPGPRLRCPCSTAARSSGWCASGAAARTGHANLLLALVMLEVWLAEYLPRAISPNRVPVAA